MAARNLGARARAAGPAALPTALHIDWTLCDGRGLCTELLPEALGRDDWGYPRGYSPLPAERSTVPIGPASIAAARDAVALCPRQALTLRPADGQR